MFWKILYWIGVTGLFLTFLGIWAVKSSEETPAPQWEVRAIKYREELPLGWEPFAYDKDSHMVFVKRIKREEVNE